MLVTFFVDSFISLLGGFLDMFQFVTIPTDMINVLVQVLTYGNWIVGSDLLIIFGTCVYLWTAVKCTLGLLLFIWKLLPLT